MIKKIFPTLYITWTLILLLFAIVSAVSYFAVVSRFGSAPGQYELSQMAESSGRSIPVFPIGLGIVLTLIFANSFLLIPATLLINLGCYFFNRSLRVPWVHYGILVVIWVVIWLLIWLTDFQGWYAKYVFD